MKCLVTAGPSCEPLDEVRRLTNMSTGRLGVRLADYLASKGCEVILLRGSTGTYGPPSSACRQSSFFTSADLESCLARETGDDVDAVLHTAAVCDFQFGRVFKQDATGQLIEQTAGKWPTHHGSLLVELQPTPKLISKLRGWFPRAHLVGWKYEVDGDRAGAVARAQDQIQTCKTNACVLNGPAYGEGYGLITAEQTAIGHYPDADQLYSGLWRWLADRAKAIESR